MHHIWFVKENAGNVTTYVGETGPTSYERLQNHISYINSNANTVKDLFTRHNTLEDLEIFRFGTDQRERHSSWTKGVQ